MAQRPLFISNPQGPSPVRVEDVQFHWFPGLSTFQKRRSIASLQSAAREQTGISKILEVSSKSDNRLGVALSAFNLLFAVSGLTAPVSVECAFQGSKVFEKGGPFTDIFSKSSRDAKGDPRIKTSGQLLSFRFLDVEWPLAPKTAFYDWLYISALHQSRDLVERISEYSAFTDIEFNPGKSFNCQAHSAALYVALKHRSFDFKFALNRDSFLSVFNFQLPGKDVGRDKIQGDFNW